MTSSDSITALSTQVMTACANAWARTNKRPVSIDQAVEAMRRELMAFLTGQEYADTRACVLEGSLSQEWALVDLVTGVLAKIPTEAR